jgi:hypothetical protein
MLAAQGTADPGSRLAETAPATDPRLLRIKQYFLERECPAHVYAEDFVTAADQNNLDWRLLPSLSMVESTGGKTARNNNMFGWDNGGTGFRSSREGIYRVASRLNRSHLYRDKNLDAMLYTYNPRAEYKERVKMVMAQLGPENLVPEGAF